MRTPKNPENPVDGPPEKAEADLRQTRMNVGRMAITLITGMNVGRMTITLIPNGTGRPIPQVSFDPVGLFTPGLLGDHLQTFAAAVEHAQAAERSRKRRDQ